MSRRGLFQSSAAHHLVHGAERGELCGAGRTVGSVRLHLVGVPGVKFAVDQRVKQNFEVIAFHGAVPEAYVSTLSMIQSVAPRSRRLDWLKACLIPGWGDAPDENKCWFLQMS
jgi:hypothetical protein